MDNQYDLTTLSDGVAYLEKGYIEYAQEVIVNRALVNVYDGLKPVNRRILVTLKKLKVTSDKAHTKSVNAVGAVTALHPHGDESIYQAMVPMTDNNGSYAFPLLDGRGSWSVFYSDEKAAQKRYTEVRLNKNADLYLQNMNGVDLIPNYDATEMEPEVLPVPFPAVLVNSSSGIAVGFGSNIPSFNFNDVCSLVEEYIQDGECHTVIAPDFVSGGYYVKNDKELMKLMRVGKGRLKLRGKTIIDGKKITCTEVPYGKTLQKLVRQANNLNTNAIRNAYDVDDYDHGCGFTVECSAKNKVDEVLYLLFKDTDLQYTYTANITVIVDGSPKTLGVWGVIEKWVEWQRGVLIKEYTHRIETAKEAFREASAFMNIISDYDKKMELVRIIADSGREAGKQYIRDNFTREEVPADLIDFCGSRSLPSYHTGGKYSGIYASGMTEVNALQKSLDNIDSVILANMKALKSSYGSSMPRRTEVTTKDYEFIESEGTKEKFIDTSSCVFEIKDGFIKKMRYSSGEKCDFVISGSANDVLVAFDNRGRLLRIYGEDLGYSGTELGTYLPVYFNLDEDDNYKITYVGAMDGRTLMLLYKDGNVGFVDTSEWINNNRNVKVLQKGISLKSAPELGAVVDYDEVPNMLFVTDKEGRVAWTYKSDIKQKDRTARTRVFDLIKDVPIDSYCFLDEVNGLMFLNNIGSYRGKLRFLNDISDFRGSAEDFTEME